MANAAVACVLGLDGWAMLTARGPAERVLRTVLLQEAVRVREELAQDLAVRIANAMNGHDT